jgi:hypothetical protein
MLSEDKESCELYNDECHRMIVTSKEEGDELNLLGQLTH